MRVVVQYRAGQVPEQEAEANERALWEWVGRLRARPEHEQTIVLGGGRTFSRDDGTPDHEGSPVHEDGPHREGTPDHEGGPQHGGDEYDGDLFGISVLQVDSFDAAADLLRDWPELRYGGRLDVLAELAPGADS
ncbi:hypothetical protein ACO0LV_05890 [Pseudactinotalea sp. Z1739]|uniref:hypothetical protein n=1 Tax=Pseudactinotalea sp. Z1739 TaxID=3413028 RepID=UPI003C7BC77A